MFPPFKVENPENLVFIKVRKNFKDNDTLVISGLAGVIDDVWYHCRICTDNDVSELRSRVGIGDKFCSECGTKFDWEHTNEYEDLP